MDACPIDNNSAFPITRSLDSSQRTLVCCFKQYIDYETELMDLANGLEDAENRAPAVKATNSRGVSAAL